MSLRCHWQQFPLLSSALPCFSASSASTAALGTNKSTAASASASTTDVGAHEEYWKPPPNMVKPPWYRGKSQAKQQQLLQQYDKIEMPSMLADEALSPVDNNPFGEWRLYDYYQVQKIVNMLPTIKEKIDFVNPYEREWRPAERRWHRRWLQPLMRPRAAWSLPPTPSYFNPLDFYKYVTNTRLIRDEDASLEFNAYYKNFSLPVGTFMKRVTETLAIHLQREEVAKRENHPAEERAENRAKFLRSLIEDAHFSMAHGMAGLLDHRLSHASRCESFWIRAGFRSLYDHLPAWELDQSAIQQKNIRFTGDDRRRLGELAFTMRDQHAVQVRNREPMRQLFDWTDKNKLNAPLFPESINVEEEVIYSPKVYNLLPDKEPLWQCPGYEYDSDETHKYGRLAVKDVVALVDRLDSYWRCESERERAEVFEDCLAATAIASLFNWLNGQAHCLGHTQFTEILEPLTSQLILSDGHKLFYFAIGQLNTIAINIKVDGFLNRRTNYCCVEGPLNLYDEFDPEKREFQYQSFEDGTMKQGLNPRVLERILQMCVVH